MIIGITGNFGAGKTTIAGMFGKLGAQVIDADCIAHKIINKDAAVYKKLLACFGKVILTGPYISRKRLADIVFSDKKKLRKLNRITHPKILDIIKSKIKNSSRSAILVVDAPLLIEAGLLSWVDKLIVVKSKSTVLSKRLKEKGIDSSQIQRRLNVQMKENKKLKLANFIVDNSGSLSQTAKQVKDIWVKISSGMTCATK